MNDKNTTQPALTPAQLADKLQILIGTVQNLAEEPDGNEWAKGIANYLSSYKMASESSIILPFHKAKELCPELYDQLIKPSIEMANKAGELHKTPDPPAYIIIDKDYNNMGYNNRLHSINIGLPCLRIRQNMEEAAAIIAHEWGHAHHNLQYRAKNRLVRTADLPVSNKGKEYAPSSDSAHHNELCADRHAAAMNNIANILTDIINKQNNYTRKYKSHPSQQERIKASLKQELGNKIFGMNGKWVENENNDVPSFTPKTLEESDDYIKRKVVEIIRRNGKSTYFGKNEYTKLPVIEDGQIIKNYSALQASIDKKSEELILKLDALIGNGFNPEKKQQWLEIANEEVEKFKKTNKPEFFDVKKLPSAKWGDKIQNLPKFQRGG